MVHCTIWLGRSSYSFLEIVAALSAGHITKRDLFKWGIFTATGYLANKNGLSPFARSAFAAVPTGTPRSPLFGAQKFTQPMPRQVVQPRIPMKALDNGDASFMGYSTASDRRNVTRMAMILPTTEELLTRILTR